jgi:phytoene dehydrogenase-like protein
MFHGMDCDRGSHRVHLDAERVLFDLTPPSLWTSRRRRGVLVLGGQHIQYPFEAPDLLRALGAPALAAIAFGWITAWRSDTTDEDRGYEHTVRARVGDAAYERFYRPYAEKVWGLDAALLSCTVAHHRMASAAPLRALLRGRSPQRFVYPTRGFGAVVDALVDKARALGVSIYTGVRFDARLDERACVYTAPLQALAPEHRLTHRGLYLVQLALPANTLDDTDTWYVPDANAWFSRVSQPARFDPAHRTPDVDLLTVEIPEGRWGLGRNFLMHLGTLIAQLHDHGIVPRGVTVLDAQQHFVSCVYPMYTRGWWRRRAEALATVARLERVWPAGRQGLFWHCNVDHSLRSACDAALSLLDAPSSSTWIARCATELGPRVRD